MIRRAWLFCARVEVTGWHSLAGLRPPLHSGAVARRKSLKALRGRPWGDKLLRRGCTRLLRHFSAGAAEFGLHDIVQAVVPAFDERRLNRCAGRLVWMLLAAFGDSRRGVPEFFRQ